MVVHLFCLYCLATKEEIDEIKALILFLSYPVSHSYGFIYH